MTRPLSMSVAAAAVASTLGCGAANSADRASAPVRAGWPSALTLGIAGGIDAEAALERNQVLADRLQTSLGIPVRLFSATSYSGVVEAMRAKRVDGLQVGVFTYLLAVEEAHAEALAVYVSTFAEPAVYDPLLRPEYYSVISVKKGSGITSLADLKGRSFAFVEPASTSGHLVPKTELMKAGIMPDRDMRTRFAGNHAASLIALWNGRVDGAVSSEQSLRNIAVGGQVEYCGFPDHEIGRARTREKIKAVFDACPDGKLAPIYYFRRALASGKRMCDFCRASHGRVPQDGSHDCAVSIPLSTAGASGRSGQRLHHRAQGARRRHPGTDRRAPDWWTDGRERDRGPARHLAVQHLEASPDSA